MLAEIRARIWQIGTLGAAVIAIGLLVMLGLTHVELNHARHDVAALNARIEDPQTGYIARLATCHGNVGRLQATLDQQTAAVAAKSAADAKALAKAEADLAAERGRSAALQVRANATLAYKPAGADACARIEDIRRRYVEGLK